MRRGPRQPVLETRTADLERLVRAWLDRRLLKESDETEAAWLVRRGSEWAGLTGNRAWGDFARELMGIREDLLHELSRGDDTSYREKCAMIHVISTILNLPANIQRDAEQAQRAIRAAQERSLHIA